MKAPSYSLTILYFRPHTTATTITTRKNKIKVLVLNFSPRTEILQILEYVINKVKNQSYNHLLIAIYIMYIVTLRKAF